MKLVSTLLLLVMAVSTGCADTNGDAPAPTPEAVAADATPTAIATTTAAVTPTAAPDVVRVDFPAWVDASPQMAVEIATADVIVQASLSSLESMTKKHQNYGYVAEVIYRFETRQYLKGHGADELEVRIGSGPKYEAFPDLLVERTESEANQLAEEMLGYSRALVRSNQDAILLLHRRQVTDDLNFTSFEGDYDRYPALGVTWLYADSEALYRHSFIGEQSDAISLADLKTRVEVLQPLTEGVYGECVIGALLRRDRVRSQVLGTYREMSIAGWRLPEPFPREEVAMDSPASQGATVFEVRGPPYRLPVFSDYWLDGNDKDLFVDDSVTDAEYTYESIKVATTLSQGIYSVYYSTYHQSLPCDRNHDVRAWRKRNTTEWVVSVKVR